MLFYLIISIYVIILVIEYYDIYFDDTVRVFLNIISR